MKIIDRRKSIEQCTESGWDAFDLFVEFPLTDEDIEVLRCMKGSFLYLKQLRTPFFKIEYEDYVIKGVRGDDHFRFAVQAEHLDEVEKLCCQFAE